MQAREQRLSRWAPWWVYVIAIVATNQLRMLWCSTTWRPGSRSSSA